MQAGRHCYFEGLPCAGSAAVARWIAGLNSTGRWTLSWKTASKETAAEDKGQPCGQAKPRRRPKRVPRVRFWPFGGAVFRPVVGLLRAQAALRFFLHRTQSIDTSRGALWLLADVFVCAEEIRWRGDVGSRLVKLPGPRFFGTLYLVEIRLAGADVRTAFPTRRKKLTGE